MGKDINRNKNKHQLLKNQVHNQLGYTIFLYKIEFRHNKI